MNKSWMMENRMSREYDVGVESFIQFGLSHAKGSNSIRCPCLKCGNRLLKDVSIVRYHLYVNRIDKSYKIWFWHGEDLNSETVSSKMENTIDEKYEHDDLFNIVNMFQSAHDESCNRSNTFDTMFDDAKKSLYPRCKKFMKLSALVRLYNLKVRYGWSNTSFSELLSIISDLLPDNNEIPTSLYAVKKTLSALGLSYQKIDACPNDCCLYRKKYANSTKCPKCGLSRWKINKNSTKENSGVTAKQMWYFPIVSRFIRMFKNLEDAKNLRWHAMDRKVDGIRDIWLTLHHGGTLLDIPGKSKDGMNSRLDLVKMNIRPELAPMVTGCIAEAQVCEEAVQFCSDFLSGLDPISLESLNSREDKQTDRLLSAETYVRPDMQQLKQAYLHILQNTEEVHPYIECSYHTKSRDDHRTVQNSEIMLVATTMQVSSAKDKNPVIGDMSFFGIIEDIWEVSYNTFNIVLFKCKWVENKTGVRTDDLHFTLVDLSRIGHSSNFFIIATHGKHVFYVSDPVDLR
ncbi:uncharacterized protein E6C27_scaffold131G00970 [Cucumis melo var. makuwa]|uniref:Transposase n=1 Tax=Cucumis melo var. makuwa TaxID=1194695 RepID=A0A5A7UGJ9_CUCMM|nr:uncharacterized protein E6C27_scaffold131G00970 [Cucumis melo var. makuwa]